MKIIKLIIIAFKGEVRDNEVSYERVEFNQPPLEYYQWHYKLKLNQL
jgi:hypothetical protein